MRGQFQPNIDHDAWLLSGTDGPHDDTPWCETCGADIDEDGDCECGLCGSCGSVECQCEEE